MMLIDSSPRKIDIPAMEENETPEISVYCNPHPKVIFNVIKRLFLKLQSTISTKVYSGATEKCQISIITPIIVFSIICLLE